MKKVFLCALLLMFSMSEIANGKTDKPIQIQEQW